MIIKLETTATADTLQDARRDLEDLAGHLNE